MNSQYFLLLFFLTTNIFCSDSEKFKIFEVSADPSLQFATKKDVDSLNKSDVQHKLVASQLHKLFNPYSMGYNFCKSQQTLRYAGAASSTIYALIVAYVSTTNNNSVFGLGLGTILILAGRTMQKAAQDYTHDKDLLIRKCTATFNLEALEQLQTFYKRNTGEPDASKFLQKIIERKKWVQDSQKTNG